MDKEVEQYVDGRIKAHEGKYHSRSKFDYSPEFLEFWKKFKGRWSEDKGRYIKVGKYDAWVEWQELTEAEQKMALKVAHRTGDKTTPDACRWLKHRRFEDY